MCTVWISCQTLVRVTCVRIVGQTQEVIFQVAKFQFKFFKALTSFFVIRLELCCFRLWLG